MDKKNSAEEVRKLLMEFAAFKNEAKALMKAKNIPYPKKVSTIQPKLRLVL
jgi:hypothetical protein